MADAGPEDPAPEGESTGPQRDELEKFRRDLAEFVRVEVQVAAAARAPQLRRAGTAALSVLAGALAFGGAFVFVNVAMLLAIATVLPGWAAALILAGAWLVVAGVTAAIAAARAAPLLARIRGDESGSPDRLQAARDRAWQDLQTDIAALTPPLAERAIAIVAPIAARVAARMAIEMASELADDVTDEAEDVGRELVDESEEIVEELAKEVPGASIANSVWDLALLPGRTGVRMVTTVLKRPRSAD